MFPGMNIVAVESIREAAGGGGIYMSSSISPLSSDVTSSSVSSTRGAKTPSGLEQVFISKPSGSLKMNF